MVTPGDFLAFAEKAHDGAQGEFDYRNAASRAYYAAFHCCYAETSRCPTPKETGKIGSHDLIYQQFKDLVGTGPEVFLLKSMAFVAQSMKAFRQRADYHIEMPFDASDSKQQLSLARKVLTRWAQLTAEFPRQLP